MLYPLGQYHLLQAFAQCSYLESWLLFLPLLPLSPKLMILHLLRDILHMQIRSHLSPEVFYCLPTALTLNSGLKVTTDPLGSPAHFLITTGSVSFLQFRYCPHTPPCTMITLSQFSVQVSPLPNVSPTTPSNVTLLPFCPVTCPTFSASRQFHSKKIVALSVLFPAVFSVKQSSS